MSRASEKTRPTPAPSALLFDLCDSIERAFAAASSISIQSSACLIEHNGPSEPKHGLNITKRT